ncbi:MAG: hypothetical protein KDA44_16480 [Planctomycetales bacterium]|nr:hypothetical protein [Planctomycetales bacterium]
MNRLATTTSLLSAVSLAAGFCAAGDRAALAAERARPPVTRWAEQLTDDSAWPEYPRPQMVRQDWLNLNGRWELAIAAGDAAQPDEFTAKILVPFPIESELGGYRGELLPDQRAWYRRRFALPDGWGGQRVLLHFGAVDWEAEVWVNQKSLGVHRGGYDPFTFDVTEAVRAGEQNEIVVAVRDPTESGSQPRGKQSLSPEGIWYTSTSGIWQTVWLEPVPRSYIARLTIRADLPSSSVKVVADAPLAAAGAEMEVVVKADGKVVASGRQAVRTPVVLPIANARWWSPSDPYLYDLEVTLLESGEPVDQVASYCGLRSIRLGKDRNGQARMAFNGEPLFQFGPLDQGYWPDGLYTAPCDEALRHDLEVAKSLGFNMVRKHVKVEPARWYYWCDRLGLLVWQDMPSGGKRAEWPADGVETERSRDSASLYRRELQAMVDFLGNSPSVVVWVPFNEGWGQFDTIAVTNWLKEYDPTRLVVSASGGNDFGCGDVNDDHFYPGPVAPPAERDRAAVLSEFGGLGLPLEGHSWHGEEDWGYRTYQTREQLTSAYEKLIAKLRPLVESRLSAAVYTQATDVEIEVNGLATYDRAVLKVDEATVRAANQRLFAPLPSQSPEERTAASVLAWWRFEEGAADSVVADLSNNLGAIAARDSSGHNNHLFAFSRRNAPAISEAAPRRTLAIPQTANLLCLDDTGRVVPGVVTRDLYLNPEVAQTHMDKLSHFPFSSFTIEASFCLARRNGEQVVLAKEEDRDGTLTPLLQLGVLGDPPVIGVDLVDSAGEPIEVRSEIEPRPNEWWHVVVTCEDGRLRLYLADDDPQHDFAVAAEAIVSGSLARRGGTWIVGRGCESGSMGRDFLGWADEIRISTKALNPNQFLFRKSR